MAAKIGIADEDSAVAMLPESRGVRGGTRGVYNEMNIATVYRFEAGPPE